MLLSADGYRCDVGKYIPWKQTRCNETTRNTKTKGPDVGVSLITKCPLDLISIFGFPEKVKRNAKP